MYRSRNATPMKRMTTPTRTSVLPPVKYSRIARNTGLSGGRMMRGRAPALGLPAALALPVPAGLALAVSAALAPAALAPDAPAAPALDVPAALALAEAPATLD